MSALNTPIEVDERCDPRLVDAIESFQRAIDARTCAESRRLPARSVKLLAIEHIAPALDAVTNELAGNRLVSPGAFKAAIDEPRHLHLLARTALRNLRCAGVDEVSAGVTVDAMRAVGHFLASWPETIRVAPQTTRGEKGAPMRLRHAEDRAGLVDWPYCELCWKLTESAYRLERDAGKTKPWFLGSLSERFCAEHARVGGTLYRKDQKNKARFQKLLQAIYAEISSDVAYRERFASPGDDALWRKAKAMSPEVFNRLAACDVPPFSPLQMRVRLAAYKVACYSPRQIARVVAIVRLQQEARASKNEAPTLSEIASHLGVTKQEVSRRLKLGGCVDFNVQDELLRWWPFDGLEGRNIVGVSNTKADSAAKEWGAPIVRYLREIYSGLPEARAASVKVQATLVQ